MSVSLIKTRPGGDLHMGALLRDALAFQGIHVRVDRPWRSLPSEYLVAEHEGYTRVWIHSASCNGKITNYDIPRGELLGVAAVITDDVSTRFVYSGFDAGETRPVEQAQEMAAAVARHFGMPVREIPDPFAGDTPAPQSGYTPCACRDCMDTTVSSDMTKPKLCSECANAGCEALPCPTSPVWGTMYDCQRDDAYGEC